MSTKHDVSDSVISMQPSNDQAFVDVRLCQSLMVRKHCARHWWDKKKHIACMTTTQYIRHHFGAKTSFHIAERTNWQSVQPNVAHGQHCIISLAKITCQAMKEVTIFTIFVQKSSIFDIRSTWLLQYSTWSSNMIRKEIKKTERFKAV